MLHTPLHSPNALLAAGGVGLFVGGGFAAAFQGIANAAPGTLFGTLLGVGWGLTQQLMDPRDPPPSVQAELRTLADYPEVRKLLREAGRSHRDMDALREFSRHLDAHVNSIVTQFAAYCAYREVRPQQLITEVVRHFFLNHCAERGVVLLRKHSLPACYMVAAHFEQHDSLVAAANDRSVPVGTTLRRLKCPYLRLDLANTRLADATSFTTDVRNGEWEVHPVPAPSDRCMERQRPEAAGHCRQRRVRNDQQGCAQAPPANDRAVDSAAQTVSHRQPLRQRLGALAPGSRTLRELRRIEEDLAANRPCGHLVVYRGTEYIAIDIHWDQDRGKGGRQSAGRNVWRLLVLRIPGGYELTDIVNYHR